MPAWSSRPRILLAISASLVALSSGPAGAATTVYKCFDRNLGVVYTDQPCRGEQLTIESGSIDPVAIAELQREREAVARSAAQRVADSRRPVADNVYAAPFVYAPPPAPDYEIYYPAGYGYLPYYTERRPRPEPTPPDARPPRQSVVPVPPPTPLRQR